MIFLGISFLLALIAGASTRRVSTTIVVFIVSWLALYLGLPVLNYGFFGILLIILACGVIALVMEGMHGGGGNRMWVPGGMTGLALVACIVLPFFGSCQAFHHAAYRGLIGDVEESTFSTDTAPVDPTQVRVVDQSLATRLGEKRLGEDPALGSIVTLGDPNIQQVGGQLYWVIPLNHSGFFKWWQNRQGTPGYIMVSATNERDVKLVQEVDGKPLRLKYNLGAMFGDDPRRYLYTNGYSRIGLTDYTFEIDDNGYPYWVVTKFERKVGYMGDDAVGIVLLDIQTGDITEYSIDEAPRWVDRIQPESIVVTQLNDWGKYVLGWWWQNMACKECLKVSPGISLVYGDDGRSYWYTGITSKGADDSTVGFVLVDTRTKEANLYKQTGATEDAAQSSAQGSVQEKGYIATSPILYNVGGLPTYFMTLKDAAGLVKLVAFVSVENYQIVGIGEDVRSALRQYRRSVSSRGNNIVPDGAVESWEITGTVLRLALDTNGNYYLLVEGHENKAFVGGASISVELPLTREGDAVTVKFDDGGNEVVDMTDFDNLELQFQKTDEQIGVEAYGDRVRESASDARLEQNANAAWEDLSPEEKAELLERSQQDGG